MENLARAVCVCARMPAQVCAPDFINPILQFVDHILKRSWIYNLWRDLKADLKNSSWRDRLLSVYFVLYAHGLLLMKSSEGVLNEPCEAADPTTAPVASWALDRSRKHKRVNW